MEKTTWGDTDYNTEAVLYGMGERDEEVEKLQDSLRAAIKGWKEAVEELQKIQAMADKIKL